MSTELLDAFALGITRIGKRKVAKLAGLDRVTIYRCFFREERQMPTLDTLVRIAPHIGLRVTAVPT
jgi:DNA-binding phage protein